MRYGKWGKHIELFELFESAAKDPAFLKGMLQEGEEELLEGSGAPEGRVDFPIFLQTVIRHRIRERFRAVAARWGDYTGIESAQDFREHTVSQLGSIRGYEGVPEHGEYPRLRSTEEEGPSYQVGKYGGIYAITFELVINDDRDQILNRIPTELGRSMGEFVSQAVVAFLESNPTFGPDGDPFFDASRDNEVTGTDAEPTEQNLAAALDTMQMRRDAEGIPINVQPRRILVREPSTKLLFDKIIRSQQTGVRADIADIGATAFAPGNFNPLFNILPPDAVIQEPWLNQVGDWYLIGDPDNRPGLIIAFLRGQREPRIFLKDSGMRGVGGGGSDPYSMDFDEIPYKCRHVFGNAAGEPLAIQRYRP